jgi:two-component system, chemotaxis family, CheB/CheR fusion protein
MTIKNNNTRRRPPRPPLGGHDQPSTAHFPIVGIGASAGGLAAFEAFFAGMPADIDSNMAFVLVQHLDPNHKSLLTELIRRYTRMQVLEVEDGMAVQPNCTYIIPPGRDMALLNGSLQLLEPVSPRGQRMPIDFFFRSLAQDQRERAIGVILSGTGSDGTFGIRAIKGEGGLVMIQTPESTEYDGMPRSALNTGLVDFQLLPAQMAAQLMAYAGQAFDQIHRLKVLPPAEAENALKKIFVLLRAQTGHDFSGYKFGTIDRRLERRMAINQIETLDGYVKYLQQTATEVEALFRDLLIGVTNFFRDPTAFKVLEERIVPQLFVGKQSDIAIRIWVPGCSTGEEAYSIAILLAELQSTLDRPRKVQIFAGDIDNQAIAVARAGLYPASIAADISPERLRRFFTAEPGGSFYRIHRDIRDMLVFSEQDIIKDPPFSKLDLISCRNLMIYFNSELQKKIIPMFHYALNPRGFLFLGSSEAIGEFVDLFATVDRRVKLYQRKGDTYNLETTSPNPSRLAPTMTDIPPLPPLKLVPPSGRTKHRCASSPSVRFSTISRQRFWSTGRATSFFSTIAPGDTWSRPRAKQESTIS